MNFEDMQKIWDKQNGQTLFAIDEDSLKKQMKVKINKANKSVDVMEYGIIVLNTIVATVLTYRGIESGKNLTLMTAGVSLVIALYMLISRTMRKKREIRYDGTMLSSLDNAISNLTYHMNKAKNFIWWYLAPFAMTTLVSMLYNFDRNKIWIWVFVILAYPLAFWMTKWEVRRVHLPRIKSLKSLKNLLQKDSDSIHE